MFTIDHKEKQFKQGVSRELNSHQTPVSLAQYVKDQAENRSCWFKSQHGQHMEGTVMPTMGQRPPQTTFILQKPV